MAVLTKSTPTFATVRRDGDTVTLRTRFPDVDPATIRATVVDGELVVTGRTNPPNGSGTAPTRTTPVGHRLVDLGPRLAPVTRR